MARSKTRRTTTARRTTSGAKKRTTARKTTSRSGDRKGTVKVSFLKKILTAEGWRRLMGGRKGSTAKKK